MTPKEKAREIFNSIRYMDNESGKDCATCDCVVLPIAKFVCDEVLQIEERNLAMGIYSDLDYWKQVKAELQALY